MSTIPLYHVWEYTDLDRAFWIEHLDGWVPKRVCDAHAHIVHPASRVVPMTEERRKEYWVAEVFEPIDAPTAERCYATVFPGREVSCVAFGMPDLDFDIESGNQYAQVECQKRQWHSLAVALPQWSSEKVASLISLPNVLGIKPYYSLIGHTPDSRDTYIEASIFDFLPHSHLEVLEDAHAWVTLHVPKRRRLGHPDNLREIAEIRRRYPHVVLVIAHLGRCYTETHALEGLPPLADDPGVYFDTSAVVNPASHRVALEHIGADRILYGTDNPVLYMRGRRRYQGDAYINHTNHPFHFNKQREAPEIEATYTLYLYEDLLALKQACLQTGVDSQRQIQGIFHDNAVRLMNSVLAHKAGGLSQEQS